jgi:hypothetical protein
MDFPSASGESVRHCCVLTEDLPSVGIVIAAGAVSGGHMIPVICGPACSMRSILGFADRLKSAAHRGSCSPRAEFGPEPDAQSGRPTDCSRTRQDENGSVFIQREVRRHLASEPAFA